MRYCWKVRADRNPPERNPAKCGVWLDGKQVMTFAEMLDKGFYEKKESP